MDQANQAFQTSRSVRTYALTLLDEDDNSNATVDVLRSAADAIDSLLRLIGSGAIEQLAMWDEYFPGRERLLAFAESGLLRTDGREELELTDVAIATIEELHQENADLRAQLAGKGRRSA